MGKTIRVFFQEREDVQEGLYRGVIRQFNSATGQHWVHYDDGDKIWHDLGQEEWEAVGLPPNPQLPDDSDADAPTQEDDAQEEQEEEPRPKRKGKQPMRPASDDDDDDDVQERPMRNGKQRAAPAPRAETVNLVSDEEGEAARPSPRRCPRRLVPRQRPQGHDLVNQRIEVLWEDKKWYKGTVAKLLDNGEHYVEYDDGDEQGEPLDSGGVKWRLLTGDDAGQVLTPERPGQIHCAICARFRPIDDFSEAVQKGEYGKHMVEPYCLVHTAGDQQDWVARLELEGESRLDGGDEAGEASDSEVDREVFRANWRNRPSGHRGAWGPRPPPQLPRTPGSSGGASSSSDAGQSGLKRMNSVIEKYETLDRERRRSRRDDGSDDDDDDEEDEGDEEEEEEEEGSDSSSA